MGGRFVLWAVGELARLPYGSLSLGQDTGLLTVGVLLLLVFFGSLPRRTKARGLLTGLAMAVALGASVGLHQLRWAGVTTLGVAEAGGSSCVVVIRDGSAGVLSLGGYNDSSGLTLLQAHNVSQVETLFLPTQDGEARLCAQRILENLPVERVLLPQGAYAGKDLEDQGVPVERASPGESFQLLPGLEAAYSQDGARLSFTAGGVDVIVELAPSGPGECQVLVTQQTDTQINSSFTVLQADGIMGETGGEEAELRSGRYVQPPEQSSLCLDFSGTARSRSGGRIDGRHQRNRTEAPAVPRAALLPVRGAGGGKIPGVPVGQADSQGRRRGQLPEFNRNELGSSATVDAIADAAEALPFFSGHKCVSVPDWDPELQDATELSKLQELLENLPETTTLVFWYPTQEPDGRKAKVKNLWKWASQYGQVLECRRRDPSELRKVLLREAEKAGCSLSRENAGKILEYAGLDLHLLLSEMQKLCAYALGTAGENPASPPEITAAMIETLVPKTAEATAFLLANALAAGNFEGAYRHLDTLLTQNQEPIAILGALSSVYVDMYRVKAALESGKPATAPAEYGDYKGREFRLRSGERNARGVPLSVLRRSLALLLQADLALKGSKLSPRTVLDQLIARLLLASQEAAS